MPKPIFGINGSGMHTNMSLFKDGKNIFFDENGSKKLSEDAYHFIAGLLHHIRGMAAILNPLVNSYKPVSYTHLDVYKRQRRREYHLRR